MKMEFVRHEPCYDRILFVLTLDRKKMKERILIGEELQVRFRLQGDMERYFKEFIEKYNKKENPKGLYLTGEAVSGLQSSLNQDYIELGAEATINFPRFMFP